MKVLIAASVLVLSSISATAAADCSTNPVSNPGSVFSGYQINGTKSDNTETYQEVHAVGGTLCEVAQGLNDPVDPSKTVGTWTSSASSDAAVAGTVTYSYSNAGPYMFYVYAGAASYPAGTGTYYFCSSAGGSVVVTGTLVTAQVTCPVQ